MIENLPKLDLLIVEWIMPTEEDEYMPPDSRVWVTVGWRVAEDDRELVLASECDPREKDARKFMRIPKQVITAQYRVRIPTGRYPGIVPPPSDWN